MLDKYVFWKPTFIKNSDEAMWPFYNKGVEVYCR